MNGEKKPNTYGKDVFTFAIKENGLYPVGCDSEGGCDGAPNFSTYSGSGVSCACKVLREGAINY